MKIRQKGIIAVPAMVIVLAVSGGALAAGSSDPDSPSPLQTTRSVFLEKCSRCHDPWHAYTAIDDKVKWSRTVAEMALKKRLWLPPSAVRQILDYRVYYSSHQRTVFLRHCGSCHTWEELTLLSKSRAQWKTCIAYMANRYGGEMSREERELLLCGLESAR